MSNPDSRINQIVDRAFNMATSEVDTVEGMLKELAKLAREGLITPQDYKILERAHTNRQNQLYAIIRLLHLIKGDVSFERYCEAEAEVRKIMGLRYECNV